MTTPDSDVARQVTGRYSLHGVGIRDLGTPVNDVVAVAAAEGEFALKLYHRNRTPTAVQWEIDLLLHLHRCGAPVVHPIRGRNGYLEALSVDGQQRVAVLFTWAAGPNPLPVTRRTACSEKRPHESIERRTVSPFHRSGKRTTQWS